MTYKFRIFEDDGLKTYQFDSKEEIKSWALDQIEKFKVKNSVTDEARDRAFIGFKSQFDEILGM